MFMKHILCPFLLIISICNLNAGVGTRIPIVSPSGHTLYYMTTSDSTVMLTYPCSGYYNCTNYYGGGYSGLTGSVVIPDSVIIDGVTYKVTSIDEYTFAISNSITSITIPRHIRSIGRYAFEQCQSLSTIIYNAKQCPSANIGVNVLASASSTTGDNNNVQNIIVGDDVTLIPNNLFNKCSSLKSITIGKSVQNMTSAFAYSKDSLSTIIYNAINCTTSSSFSFCYQLNNIIIGNEVEVLPDCIFQGDTSIIEVVLPNSLTTIGANAFYNTRIRAITLPQSIVTIGDGAFSNSTLDTVYFFADSCLYMGNRQSSYPYRIESPFGSDYHLTSNNTITTLIIGENVKIIPNCAFYHCRQISNVNILSANPPECSNTYSFYSNIRTSASFNIPCRTREFYEIAWSYSYNFVEPPAPNFAVSLLPTGSSASVSWDTLSGVATFSAYGVRCDSSAVIIGQPRYGYYFTQWNDGNTDNPRTIHLTSDTTFTALFNKRMFYVYTWTEDTVHGYVSGIDSARYLDTVTVTAYPVHGYELAYWTYDDRNGNIVYCYDNPARIPIEQTILMEAHFAPIALNVQFLTEGNCGYIQEEYYRFQGNYGYGPVYGWGTHTGNYHYLDSVRITAHPHYGYRFKQWSDGNRDNPRYIKLFQDTMLTALFDRDSVWLTVVSADTTLGIVTGSGWYAIYDTATLVAIPAEHYHLTEWIVDVPYSYANYDPHNNPLCLYVENAGTVTALFAIDTHTVSVVSNDILHGNVEGGGEFEYGAPCTITATAYSGYRFVRWSNGVTYNPYTFAVTTDMELTAIFVEEGSIYNIIATVADPTMGTVTGAGPYGVGEEAVLTAIPNTGYQFDHWQDNNTQNPRTITVTGNATYTAYFVSTQGIDDVNTDAVNVYTLGGQIVVETEQNDEIGIYDIVGRKVDGGRKTFFDVPASGVYLVKVGPMPLQKVVVIK